MNANQRQWRKSSFCATGSSCVEVAMEPGLVKVRDGKEGGAGAVLSFTAQEWVTFVDGVRAGEFDAA